MKTKAFALPSLLLFLPLTAIPLAAQSLVTEDAAAGEVAVAADLVIEGNDDATTAALEVEGDAVVQGDHYVHGSLVLQEPEDAPSAPVAGAIRYNSGETDFEGYDGSAWRSLTVGSGSGSVFSGAIVRGAGNNTASGQNATAWGWNNTVAGSYSAAWGESNTTNSGNATAWGVRNIASGHKSTAWGGRNKATGEGSTAWGNSNTASQGFSTSWGYCNTADNWYSTAWGNGNKSSGKYSTAWGVYNRVNGLAATAWGFRTNAKSHSSTAFGRFNIGGFTFLDDNKDNNDGNLQWFDADPLLEIGVGTSFHHSANALTLLKDGRIALGRHTALEDLQSREETVQVEGALLLGDYAEAPDAPTPGAIRYNSTDADFEGYKDDDDGWVSLTTPEVDTVQSASSLVVPGSTTAKLSVDANGRVLLAEAQGDIPMFGQ